MTPSHWRTASSRGLVFGSPVVAPPAGRVSGTFCRISIEVPLVRTLSSHGVQPSSGNVL